MSVQGIDYAGGTPSGSDIIAAGYGFVCRYLSNGAPKELSPAEATDLNGAGVEIVSNWETTGTTALGGYGAGVSDAQAALAQATLCGMPAGRPIYFSLDWDATPEQQDVINAYFQGVASVLGLAATGAYGGYWPLSRALDAGVITWAWQTQAWSGGNQDPRINILQNNDAGYVYVDGVECDLDQALTEDYGQWNQDQPTGGMGMSDANSVQSDIEGVSYQQTGVADGTPDGWRLVEARHPRNIGDIVNDPTRGPWTSTHNSVEYDGTFDAFEQGVTTAEQLAWTHKFSDGIIRDSGDVLIELMEYAIQWRKANNLPTTAGTVTAEAQVALRNSSEFKARVTLAQEKRRAAAHWRGRNHPATPAGR